MNLPCTPPILPMLAKRVGELPREGEWIFEPKWDGFRSLVFRDGSEIYIQSRDAKPLNRYFPELVEALHSNLPERCVLDGEIVIVHGNLLDFDLLQLRLHPAASRVKLLAGQHPFRVAGFTATTDRILHHAPEPLAQVNAAGLIPVSLIRWEMTGVAEKE